MTNLNNLVKYTNDLLNINSINDYCPNGLQIAGKSKINKIVSGVTANINLIDAAITKKADLLLVHHGFFWKNESPQLTGIKGNRVR
jgi:putative NIF3 family GTP cyclohydrolase 1 type 2